MSNELERFFNLSNNNNNKGNNVNRSSTDNSETVSNIEEPNSYQPYPNTSLFTRESSKNAEDFPLELEFTFSRELERLKEPEINIQDLNNLDSFSSVDCDINMPSIENEGISLKTDNWITRREETVTRIRQFIQQDRVILIRAPPFTGKTSLCILLEEYYRKKGTPVLQVCFLGVEDMPFEEFWINETGKSWKYWLNPKHGERVIILDETHHIFDGQQYDTFWLRIKSLCRQGSLGRDTIKVVAFSTGGRLATLAQSPVDFQQKYGFGLVRCTESELFELVEAFNTYNSKKKIFVSNKIAKHIMDFTAGHLGLIRWILNGIDNHFAYRGTNYKKTTDSQIMSYFTTPDFIEHLKAHRGAPLYKFNKEEGEVIDKLLLRDEIRIPSTGPDATVTALLKAGVLFYIDDKGPEFILREGRVGFVSPVARLLSFFHRCISAKNPLEEGFSLQDLVRESLARLNSRALSNSLGRSKDGVRLLERVWQMEFYRAIYSCLPEDMHISPDVGKIFAVDGAVDFYISEPQWAIELLIDGTDLKKHHQRFKDDYFLKTISIRDSLSTDQLGGTYSSIPIKSFILIDIRETKSLVKSYPNTWHITPEKDFTTFTVTDGSAIFEVSVRQPTLAPSILTPSHEKEAMQFELINLKRKREETEEHERVKKRQYRQEAVENLERLVDFLTKREKYLKERGANDEAKEVQRQLDKAAQELAQTLYEAVSTQTAGRECVGRILGLASASNLLVPALSRSGSVSSTTSCQSQVGKSADDN
ncbi:hypothetical protein G9A89_023214 [Geosiphon pyriformis]|nr:hypothetical protein G9A89_023214 [Geosiphon pyriformis]